MSSQEYAQMIEIPISTCTVTEEVKPAKKRRKGWFLRRANREILKDVQKPIEDKSGPISPIINKKSLGEQL